MADQDQAAEAVGRLLGAIGRGSARDADRAYRELYLIGVPAIPALQEALFAGDLFELNKPTMARLTTLLTLIHDIDEARAAETAAKLINRRCNPVYALRIKTVLGYRRAAFAQYEVHGIAVHEALSLPRNRKRRRLLAKWIATLPPGDIDGVEKIYLIPRKQQDYAGTYAPYLGVITLVWDNAFERDGPLAAIGHVLIERTFYHEVGHHVHRHTYGQDTVQEDEAEAYAIARVRAAHPRFRKVGRWLWSVRPRLGLTKWLGARLRRRRRV